MAGARPGKLVRYAVVGQGYIAQAAVRLFVSSFTMKVADAGDIRLRDPAEGGGTLYDIGIYCINAGRHLLYESARRLRPVKLGREEHRRHPTLRQEIHRPPVRMPALVGASPPSG